MSGLCSMGAAAITSGTLIKPTPSAFANRRSHCGCGACSSSRHCARHASAIRSELFHPMPAKRACRSTRTAHSSSSSSSLHHHQPQQQPASRFDCFCTCPHPDRPSIDVLEAHMNQLPRPVAVHPLFPHSEVDSKSVSGKSCCPSKVGAAQTVRHRAREVVAPGSRLSWHNPIQSVHKIAHNHQLLSLDCCGHVGSTVATQLHSGLATSQRPQKNTRPHCCAPVLTGDSSLPSPTDSSTRLVASLCYCPLCLGC